MDMDVSMDIHEKSVDVDMDLDGKFHIYGNPAKYSSHIDNTTISNNLAIIGDSVIYCNELCGILCYLAGFLAWRACDEDDCQIVVSDVEYCAHVFNVFHILLSHLLLFIGTC